MVLNATAADFFAGNNFISQRKVRYSDKGISGGVSESMLKK